MPHGSISTPNRRANSTTCKALIFNPFNSNDPISRTRRPRISESARESPHRRVPKNSACERSHDVNSVCSKRQSLNEAPFSREAAKRAARKREKERLRYSPLQRSTVRWRAVVSAKLAPESRQSTNRTRWRLHPEKSAFERSQFRKSTSEHCT